MTEQSYPGNVGPLQLADKVENAWRWNNVKSNGAFINSLSMDEQAAIVAALRGLAQAKHASPQEVQEACAQVADREAETRKREEANHRDSPKDAYIVGREVATARRIATSIRALIPRAQSESKLTTADERWCAANGISYDDPTMQRAKSRLPSGEDLSGWAQLTRTYNRHHDPHLEKLATWLDGFAQTVSSVPSTSRATCNDRGTIGGFVSADSGYQDDPCPDCAATDRSDK